MSPPLWAHQAAALAHIQARHRERPGAGTLLALDMGTGKTRVAVEAMVESRRATRDPAWCSIIIAPRNVVATWGVEIERWWPEDLEKPTIVLHPWRAERSEGCRQGRRSAKPVYPGTELRGAGAHGPALSLHSAAILARRDR